MTSGVYAIVNRENGKRYVGSSANIEDRWKRHIRLLDTGRHHSPHLQRSWKKHGHTCFEFVILIECPATELLVREQGFIDSFEPEFNVSPTAGRVTGVIRSNEYRRRQRVSQSGKRLSDETKRKISAGMKGKRNSLGIKRINSQETRDRISNTLKGHPVSDETRKKIGAMNRHYRHTEEAKRKISNSLIGNKRATGAGKNDC